MCPGISGPGIRIYPFTHKPVGFGLLLEIDGRPDHLFLGTVQMKPAEVIQALVHRFLGTDHFRRIHVIHDGLYPGF
jgi:hypothetical protein